MISETDFNTYSAVRLIIKAIEANYEDGIISTSYAKTKKIKQGIYISTDDNHQVLIIFTPWVCWKYRAKKIPFSELSSKANLIEELKVNGCILYEVSSIENLALPNIQTIPSSKHISRKERLAKWDVMTKMYDDIQQGA